MYEKNIEIKKTTLVYEQEDYEGKIGDKKMVICISCGLTSEAVDNKSATHMMKKDEDGNWHWKECHRVGGKLNANIPIYNGEILKMNEAQEFNRGENMEQENQKTTLVYEQEDYDGKLKTYRKSFSSQDEKFQWIKDMRTSAKYIGKPFQVIRLEAEELVIEEK